jgi:hypothetical protein
MSAMRRVKRIVMVLAGAIGIACGSFDAASARVADSAQCAAAANLVHVRERIEGALEVLTRDTHYYDGHRLAAIDALSDARIELLAAEKVAVQTYGDPPACFPIGESTGGGGFPWDLRADEGARDPWGLARWVRELTDQLSHDVRPYNGHLRASIDNLNIARGELLANEQLAIARAN